MALAKCLGLYWSPTVNVFKDADIGRDIQVRTRSKHEWDLIVRPQDNDDDTFYLVTGVCPSFIVQGSILGRDAKRKEWLRDYGKRPPAYFVPKRMLKEVR